MNWWDDIAPLFDVAAWCSRHLSGVAPEYRLALALHIVIGILGILAGLALLVAAFNNWVRG